MDFPASFFTSNRRKTTVNGKYVSSLIPVFLDLCANSYFISQDIKCKLGIKISSYCAFMSFKWIILYSQKIAFHFEFKQLTQFLQVKSHLQNLLLIRKCTNAILDISVSINHIRKLVYYNKKSQVNQLAPYSFQLYTGHMGTHVISYLVC